MRWNRVFAIAAAAALAVTVDAQQPQQPAPSSLPAVTFQAEVTYVDVDASVFDQQGNFIADLKKEDFEIFEDGKLQKTETFSLVEIPFERQDRFRLLDRPIRHDVRSNRRPFDGRLYVIVLDDFDVATSRTPIVKKGARQFIEKNFGANDIGAVIYTSGRADAMQDFTSDSQLLLASIDKFIGRRLRSPTLEKLDKYYQNVVLASSMSDDGSGDPTLQQEQNPDQGGHSRMDPTDFERTYRALNVLNSLKNLSEYLEGVRGRRKSLLLFSEGIDYMILDPFNNQGAPDIIHATQDAINAAARANVNFFTLDPRGLIGMTSEWMEMQGSGAPELMGNPAPSMVGLGFSTDPQPINAQSDLMTELRLSQDSLRTLAEETGGFAAVNKNSLDEAFARIAEVGSRYYVMGYYPPTHPRDGRFHKIEVRVKRPGLKVTARKGYASPRGKTIEERKRDEEARRTRDARKPLADKTSSELRETLSMPLPQSGLSFSVQAAAFRNTGSKKDASVAVTIEVDGDRLPLNPLPSGLVGNQLEFSMFDLTEAGKAQQGVRSTIDLTLRPDTAQRVKFAGVRANPRMILAPGRYQIRVGVRETGGPSAGSVFYDLQVPDFTKDDLMISGLLLTASSALVTPTPQPDPVVAKLLPGPATSRREFAKGDRLALLAEIYDNSSSQQPRSIDVSVRLLGEDGTEAFTARDTIDNAGAKTPKHWDAYSFTKEIPLSTVAPGRYLLRVESQVRGNTKLKPGVETVITIR
jgi:VWFA-related protein